MQNIRCQWKLSNKDRQLQPPKHYKEKHHDSLRDACVCVKKKLFMISCCRKTSCIWGQEESDAKLDMRAVLDLYIMERNNMLWWLIFVWLWAVAKLETWWEIDKGMSSYLSGIWCFHYMTVCWLKKDEVNLQVQENPSANTISTLLQNHNPTKSVTTQNTEKQKCKRDLIVSRQKSVSQDYKTRVAHFWEIHFLLDETVRWRRLNALSCLYSKYKATARSLLA